MIMLIKKHQDILKGEKEKSFHDGFELGKKIATSDLERGFRNTLENYNQVSVGVRAENARLTIQVKKLEKELAKKDKAIEGLDKISKTLQEQLYSVKESKDEEIKGLEKRVIKLQEENFDYEKKVRILRFFLRTTYNKDISRYENIAKRTKKIRIKEKAEKKIIKLKELALAFE